MEGVAKSRDEAPQGSQSGEGPATPPPVHELGLPFPQPALTLNRGHQMGESSQRSASCAQPSRPIGHPQALSASVGSERTARQIGIAHAAMATRKTQR